LAILIPVNAIRQLGCQDDVLDGVEPGLVKRGSLINAEMDSCRWTTDQAKTSVERVRFLRIGASGEIQRAESEGAALGALFVSQNP